MWIRSSIILAVVAIVCRLCWEQISSKGEAFQIISRSEALVKAIDLYYDVDEVDFSRQKLGTNQYNRPMSMVKDRTKIGKENATILMLTRNWELPGVLSSMRSLEDRFNRDYKYTWTFLNDEPFTDEFKRQTTEMASGHTEYGLIEPDIWNVPEFINQTKMHECMESMIENNVIYLHSVSYRNMCRFNSGYFFRQPLTLKYDYYFRVEPDVEYMCDFQYDPFELMRVQDKNYGFVLTFYEYNNTIPTLWDNVEEFMRLHPEHIHPNSAIDFITTQDLIGPSGIEQDESRYNMCHFWSNFEIGNLNFFRSQAYLDFFHHLEQSGGFYYERWGDLPVHSILVSLLMDKKKIHHFEDIGYFHNPFMTCPSSTNLRAKKRCICRKDTEALDTTPHSCLPRWWKYGTGHNFLNDI